MSSSSNPNDQVGRRQLFGLAGAVCAFAAVGCSAAQPHHLALRVPVGDIPVSGGKIFRHERLVVTQPSGGYFKVFSAICRHQGCLVRDIDNDRIQCGCHGSEFTLTDGDVTMGPATTGLEQIPFRLDGAYIVVD